MIVNTETHNWSKYRESVSVRSSATVIYLVSHSIPRLGDHSRTVIEETIRGRCKKELPILLQCFLDTRKPLDS